MVVVPEVGAFIARAAIGHYNETNRLVGLQHLQVSVHGGDTQVFMPDARCFADFVRGEGADGSSKNMFNGDALRSTSVHEFDRKGVAGIQMIIKYQLALKRAAVSIRQGRAARGGTHGDVDVLFSLGNGGVIEISSVKSRIRCSKTQR